MFEFLYETEEGSVGYYRTVQNSIFEAEMAAGKECPDAIDAGLEVNIYHEGEYDETKI